MLPPFRVRCLQRPASPGRSIQTKSSFDALVRISAPEYDTTIRICPEASLKYLDEDDGETITVGSSLELIHRLESPLRENFHYLPCIKNLPSSSDKLNVTDDGPCPTTRKCHIFGIDCRISSLEIWREIERRSKEGEVMLGPPNCLQMLESGATSENERDLLLLSNRRNWGKTTAPICSYRSMIAEDVCADDLKVHVDESDDVSRLQELEDYRTAYFQVSYPPQAKSSPCATVSRGTESDHKSEMYHPSMENPSHASVTAYPSCNLMLEGKRQAQAAGDKLRARTTPSRRKRDIAASFDQAGYQNRWAFYSDPVSFHHKNLGGLSQISNEPKLSSEGKRQPQLAGEKLRCRTNPVRHTKSLRGPTDYGVIKNRRCSLAVPHVIHCNDRAEPSRSTKLLEAGNQVKIEVQPSLLQVFEAELAKLSSISSPTEYKENITELGVLAKSPSVPSSEEPHLSAEEAIRDAKASLNDMGPMGQQPCLQLLELALHATFSIFGTFATQLANCVQEVSATIQLAEKTREIDTQVLDNAVASFRSFAEEIAVLEKALRKEPKSSEETRAKPDRRADPSSLEDDKGLKSTCTVILWPISSELESKEIQDILLLHTTRVKSVYISEASDGGLRLAFCAVKDDASAQIISRNMAGQMLNGNRLNVVITPALEGSFVPKENDVFKKVASQKNSPSLVLQNRSAVAPPSTSSLPAPPVEISGTIDVIEERNPTAKPVATNLNVSDHSKWRSDSKPAKPVSLLSNYVRSESRLKISNHPTDSVEMVTQVDRRDSNPHILSADTGEMQSPLKDTAVTCPDLCKGVSFDPEELWGSQSRSTCLLPLQPTPTRLLRCHEPGPLHLGQDGVPVLHGSSSSRNQLYLKSHPAASRSSSLAPDEHVSPKIGLPPVPYTPLRLAPDLCGRECICSLDQSLLNSSLSNVEDHLNPRTESLRGRVMSGQKNVVRACRSTGTLFHHDDPVDHGQSQAGETITGKTESARASLGPTLSRMPSELVCDTFEDKTDLPNYGARSSTRVKNFQTSGSSSSLLSLPDNTDVNQSNRAISTSVYFSDQNALSEGLEQQPDTSPLTSRFPTLEQFEGTHFESACRFPTTSRTISLTDPRPRAQSTGDQSLKPQNSSLSGPNRSNFAISEKWNNEKRLNTTAPDTAESSGEFFNRMTKVACNSMTYHLPLTSSTERGSTGSCVSVGRKYPSQANIAPAYRNRSTHNVRRSSTITGFNDTLIRNNRRPYSENLSGNGRVAWDSFLLKDDQYMDNYPKDIAATTNQEAQTVRSIFNGQAAFAFKDGEFDEAASEVRDVSFAGEHSDAASVRKVQECVSQLQELGFGGDVDGGIRRLVVYAQAAEGDLAGAIDMIDEEKRAYKERNFRM